MARFHIPYPSLGLLVGLLVFTANVAWSEEPTPSHDEIVHVLNRITFGPRPGDVEAVQKMGIQAYIEQQLHPETIDDSTIEQQVAQFDMLRMSSKQLQEIFTPGLRKHKDPAPSGTNMQSTAMQTAPNPTAPAMQMQAEDDATEDAGHERSQFAIVQLEEAKLARAVGSERQLQEVLVDFWTNHFNIDVKKGPDRVYKIVDDRDVIRPHIWGYFRDLLEASAKSPAMIYYLDNATESGRAESFGQGTDGPAPLSGGFYQGRYGP